MGPSYQPVTCQIEYQNGDPYYFELVQGWMTFLQFNGFNIGDIIRFSFHNVHFSNIVNVCNVMFWNYANPNYLFLLHSSI